jgi:hypothetical protein
MTRGPVTLGAFVTRVFLWLPVAFAAWYVAASIHSGIVAGFARFFVALFNGLLVSSTELRTELVFVTTLKVAQAGQAGVLTVEVNPLIYTYGLALFLALMLASRARWWLILAGAAMLLPFQGWGVAFDFLAQVGAKMGPDIAAQAGLLQSREAIALAYQLGNLVFPSLVPVMAWVALQRGFIETLRVRASPAASHTA